MLPNTPVSTISDEGMTILSYLLLAPREAESARPSSTMTALRNITEGDFARLVTLADSNHVIVRGLESFQQIMVDGQDATRAEWAATAVGAERSRIAKAAGYLRLICDAFVEEGLDVTVMKSLDHWPDLGSDLDLYTNSPAQAVVELMQKRFEAQIAPRSWGDRLACKWNFLISGLPEPVEVHMGRLGQMGEQRVLASRLPDRSRVLEYDGQAFAVPSASDRLMISTLQRMYRHFYFRLCDIVDSAELAASGAIDYEELRFSAEAAGIWEGVATYLVIVSDYIREFGSAELALPKFVGDSAYFGGEVVYFSRGFLRIPILPQSAGLYRSQLSTSLRKRQYDSTARLGLLPWLATAAAVGHKVTGSDKGIW